MSSSNPFMAMLAALEEGSSSQPDRAANENMEAGTGRSSDIKLPEFWPQAPVLWFSRAECIVILRHVEDEVTKYCAVVACLPHDVLRQVADLLDIAALTEPYKQLKDRLLSAHELTPIQRAERVMKMAWAARSLLSYWRPCLSGAPGVKSGRRFSLLLFSAGCPTSCAFC
jgi:hypothetical protein